VEPEWLDALPPNDPRAVRSRADLRRVNLLMNHAAILARLLEGAELRTGPARWVELGAGDGTLLLRLARQLGPNWRGSDAILVDRQDLLQPPTRAALAAAGWRVQAATSDAAAWLRQADSASADIVFANLFLHQLEDADLRETLSAAARVAPVFVALEPRRSALTHFFSRHLRWLGCGEVSCYDGPVSVRAGFRASELSELWPPDPQWRLAERAVGWFSHCLVARRVAPL
jgi:hypothetical protein